MKNGGLVEAFELTQLFLELLETSAVKNGGLVEAPPLDGAP